MTFFSKARILRIAVEIITRDTTAAGVLQHIFRPSVWIYLTYMESPATQCPPRFYHMPSLDDT